MGVQFDWQMDEEADDVIEPALLPPVGHGSTAAARNSNVEKNPALLRLQINSRSSRKNDESRLYLFTILLIVCGLLAMYLFI